MNRVMPLTGNNAEEIKKTEKIIETALKHGYVKAEIGTLDNSIPILVDLEQRIAIPIPIEKK